MNSLNKGKRAFIQDSTLKTKSDKVKHQELLMEYFQLEKEVVLQKNKVKKQKEKRENLRHEIAFLRRRHGYLSKNSGAKGDILAKKSNGTISISVEKCDSEQVNKEKCGNGEKMLRKSSQLNKISKYGLTSDKRVKKKKVSWQDQIPEKF